eukprot:TRINITY_DN4022_c1_g1_i1.p2 TRINITY_DN4022_c1_g1~~TRINITY_DN4022_c1_g1_i1.p2  ORF type:complete len:102 (-),score=48.26 TRINITY_DN4022_c1_g1_i1:18-296(-)
MAAEAAAEGEQQAGKECREGAGQVENAEKKQVEEEEEEDDGVVILGDSLSTDISVANVTSQQKYAAKRKAGDDHPDNAEMETTKKQRAERED